MTKDDTIRMAREAGLSDGVAETVAFANIAVAAEREACAKGSGSPSQRRKNMSKIHPLNAKWDAIAALTCALEETEPDEQVFVIVRKKDMTRCKYAANITNMEVHWECSRIAAEIVTGRGSE